MGTKRAPTQHPWCNTLRWFPGPYFTLCCNERQFQRVLAHLHYKNGDVAFVNNDANATTHTFTRNGQSTCVVCLGPEARKRTAAEVAGLIAHEAMHVLDEIWLAAGEKQPASEQKAYAIQHVVTELTRLYGRLKGR